MLRLLFFLVPLVLSIYCIVEAISARDDEVRNLSKVWWILLVLFFPFVGSIAWLVAGGTVPTSAARARSPSTTVPAGSRLPTPPPTRRS